MYKIEDKKIVYSFNSNKGVINPENVKKVFIQSYTDEYKEIEKTKKKGITFLIIGLVCFIAGFPLMMAEQPIAMLLSIIGVLGIGLFVFAIMLNTKRKKKVNNTFNNGDIEAVIIIEKNSNQVTTSATGDVVSLNDEVIIYGGVLDSCKSEKEKLEQALFGI